MDNLTYVLKELRFYELFFVYHQSNNTYKNINISSTDRRSWFVLLFLVEGKRKKQIYTKARKLAKKLSKKAKAATKQAGKALKNVAKRAGKIVAIVTSGGFKECLSAATDFIPVVGNIKSGIEFITGKDPITGRKLEPWERAVSGVGIVGGPAAKAAKHAGKLAIKGGKLLQQGDKLFQQGGKLSEKGGNLLEKRGSVLEKAVGGLALSVTTLSIVNVHQY